MTAKIIRIIKIGRDSWTGLELTKDQLPECDRCGKRHAKVYVIRLDDGSTTSVGSTCAMQILGFSGNRQMRAAEEAYTVQIAIEQLVAATMQKHAWMRELPTRFGHFPEEWVEWNSGYYRPINLISEFMALG